MPDATQVVYMRLKTKTLDALKEIAKEDDRSVANMADRVMALGIEAWRKTKGQGATP